MMKKTWLVYLVLAVIAYLLLFRVIFARKQLVAGNATAADPKQMQIEGINQRIKNITGALAVKYPQSMAGQSPQALDWYAPPQPVPADSTTYTFSSN